MQTTSLFSGVTYTLLAVCSLHGVKNMTLLPASACRTAAALQAPRLVTPTSSPAYSDRSPSSSSSLSTPLASSSTRKPDDLQKMTAGHFLQKLYATMKNSEDVLCDEFWTYLGIQWQDKTKLYRVTLQKNYYQLVISDMQLFSPDVEKEKPLVHSLYIRDPFYYSWEQQTCKKYRQAICHFLDWAGEKLNTPCLKEDLGLTPNIFPSRSYAMPIDTLGELKSRLLTGQKNNNILQSFQRSLEDNNFSVETSADYAQQVHKLFSGADTQPLDPLLQLANRPQFVAIRSFFRWALPLIGKQSLLQKHQLIPPEEQPPVTPTQYRITPTQMIQQGAKCAQPLTQSYKSEPSYYNTFTTMTVQQFRERLWAHDLDNRNHILPLKTQFKEWLKTEMPSAKYWPIISSVETWWKQCRELQNDNRMVSNIARTPFPQTNTNIKRYLTWLLSSPIFDLPATPIQNSASQESAGKTQRSDDLPEEHDLKQPPTKKACRHQLPTPSSAAKLPDANPLATSSSAAPLSSRTRSHTTELSQSSPKQTLPKKHQFSKKKPPQHQPPKPASAELPVANPLASSSTSEARHAPAVWHDSKKRQQDADEDFVNSLFKEFSTAALNTTDQEEEIRLHNLFWGSPDTSLMLFGDVV